MWLWLSNPDVSKAEIDVVINEDVVAQNGIWGEQKILKFHLIELFAAWSAFIGGTTQP